MKINREFWRVYAETEYKDFLDSEESLAFYSACEKEGQNVRWVKVIELEQEWAEDNKKE